MVGSSLDSRPALDKLTPVVPRFLFQLQWAASPSFTPMRQVRKGLAMALPDACCGPMETSNGKIHLACPRPAGIWPRSAETPSLNAAAMCRVDSADQQSLVLADLYGMESRFAAYVAGGSCRENCTVGPRLD